MYYFRVDSGAEERTAKRLRMRYPELNFQVPMKRQVGAQDKLAPLLPGIVLVDQQHPQLPNQLLPVSPQDEKRIEMLSAKEISSATYDGKKLIFTDGPLSQCTPFVKRVNESRGSVLLNIRILGLFWDLWYPVKITKIAAAVESEKRIMATGRGITAFVPAQIDWNQVLKKPESKADQPSAEMEPPSASAAVARKQPRSSAKKEKAAEPSAKKEKVAESSAPRRRNPRKKAEASPAEAGQNDLEALIAENAALRERVASLQERIAALKAELQS